MLEKSFGLLFYLKPAKNQKGNVRYVYLRITVQGKSCRAIYKKAMEYQTLEFHSWKSDLQQGRHQNA